MSRVYLDHASSSPLRPSVLAAMMPFLEGQPGDPGRVHAEGQVTRVAVETAREQVAAFVGARPREVLFTASGSEAINTALLGAMWKTSNPRAHVVMSAVEHSAVLEAARRFPQPPVVIGVDRFGRCAASDVLAAIDDDTALVSVQTANHEVGTLQPYREVVAGCRERGVLVHVDACASFGHAPLDFVAAGADLVSITAHKVGGPKGAAALLIRRGLRMPAMIVGGSQERARRAGIENVPAIVGFGALADALRASQTLESARLRSLTDAVVERALTIEDIVQYGDPLDRLPHMVCLGTDDVLAEPVLLGLDQRGVAVHSGSSCSSEMLEPSPVLEAMGVDGQRSLRVSAGWSSESDDAERFGAALVDTLSALRRLGTPRGTQPEPRGTKST